MEQGSGPKDWSFAFNLLTLLVPSSIDAWRVDNTCEVLLIKRCDGFGESSWWRSCLQSVPCNKICNSATPGILRFLQRHQTLLQSSQHKQAKNQGFTLLYSQLTSKIQFVTILYSWGKSSSLQSSFWFWSLNPKPKLAVTNITMKYTLNDLEMRED